MDTTLCPAHLVVVGLINLTSVPGTFGTQVFIDFQNPKVTRQTATQLALCAELGLGTSHQLAPGSGVSLIF